MRTLRLTIYDRQLNRFVIEVFVMSIIYLPPGHLMSMHAVVRVGPSGTIVDLQLDVTASKEFNGYDEEDIERGIGRITVDKKEYDVYMEEVTGRLWYDDERWY